MTTTETVTWVDFLLRQVEDMREQTLPLVSSADLRTKITAQRYLRALTAFGVMLESRRAEPNVSHLDVIAILAALGMEKVT